MFCDILQTLKTSNYLQNVKTQMAESLIIISSIITTFQTMITDKTEENNNSNFNKMYIEAINICKENSVLIPIKHSKN